MIKPLAIFVGTFLILILFFSSLALHVETIVSNGFSMAPGQLSFPTILLPIAVVKKHGISLGLAIGAGVAAGLHQIVFRYLIVERWHWVTDEQYRKLVGKKGEK